MTGSPEAHRVAAALQFTLPGVPMVFAGDEIGLEGVLGEDSRRTMPWDRPEAWDRDTLHLYGRLATLRRQHVALRRGGLRWAHVGDDCLAFVREHPHGSVLVRVARAATPGVHLPAGVLGADGGDSLLSTTGGAGLGTEDDQVVVPPTASAGLDLWLLRAGAVRA
jgi:alpha-glucosidase